MAEIKAFVAHSFSETDKELIGIFVEHFNSLASSFPGFTWDHAQQAEAESVQTRCWLKSKAKTFFIGICTRTECAVNPMALSRLPILKTMTFKESEGQWKTSDWIIQEVGLAVGRGMKVIIFLENGVRELGGLFGDIEYIGFSRRNPQASFDKLLQMLGALTPKQVAVFSLAEAKSATSDKPKEAEESGDNWEPQADWSKSRYERAAFRVIVFMRDDQAFEKINAAYKGSPFAKGIDLTIWEARVEFLRMLGGEKADFEKVKKSATDNPKNSQLLFFLASGYREYGEHELAARTFEDAAGNSADETERLRYLVNAASQYAQAGQLPRSREIVEVLKDEVADKPDLQYDLLSSLREFSRVRKERCARACHNGANGGVAPG